MRGLSSEHLQQVNQQSYSAAYGQPGYASGDFYYGPVVDGRFIRELPDQAYKYGRFYNDPLLVDRDAYEGYIFTQPNLTASQAIETADAQILFPFAGQSFFSWLYQLYPASEFNSTVSQRATWFGDVIINCKSPTPSLHIFEIRG
jgi:carboxylesterase type B